ncbi:TIGR02117 family protein [Flavobacterium sp. DG1-102-2]|uniref:TIGR02117 family protein n=1 Tax=Flavobacterium sp. DG1-102-2 TaxID=3081663 RepID=UPI0029498C02|nr:TIGR02117 family protein [Flavobacterium sp. DG1-102-2]MDV6167336.1 TIGR02117 family protein [Flavobacterium sp. DG1-102-2]
MNKKLRQVLKFTGRFILAVLIFLAVYVIAAFALAHITVNSTPEKSEDVTIYINSNGVHTDIVVPVKNEVKDWTKQIRYDQTKSKDSLMYYVAFGWGDKGFYLDTPEWSDLKASTAAKAAFYLGTSAMHTRFYNTIKEDAECVKVTISKKDYQDMVKYIEDSFTLDADGHVQCIANQSYGQYDAFYEANGKYSLFYTCNTWANNCLKAGHQKAALWTVYDKGIFYHYQ